MSKGKEKVILHFFKVAVAQDPLKSDAKYAQAHLEDTEDVVSVEYLRSTMRSKADDGD